MSAMHTEARASPAVGAMEPDVRMLELSEMTGSSIRKQQRACFYWEFARSSQLLIVRLEHMRILEMLRSSTRLARTLFRQLRGALPAIDGIPIDFLILSDAQRQAWGTAWEALEPFRRFVGRHSAENLKDLEHEDGETHQIVHSFPTLDWFACKDHRCCYSDYTVADAWMHGLETDLEPALRIAKIPVAVHENEVQHHADGSRWYVPDSTGFPPRVSGGEFEHYLISIPNCYSRREKLAAFEKALDSVAPCSAPEPKRSVLRTADGTPLTIDYSAALGDLFVFRAFHSSGNWATFRTRYRNSFCRITGRAGLPDHDQLVDQVCRVISILRWFETGRVVPIERRPREP